MDTDFIDIKIVSLEEEMMVESPIRPELWYVYFKLTQTPIPLWLTHFVEARKVARHPHWRRAWVDRKFIIVECLPEEIEKYHFDDLKQDIASANEACWRYFQSKPSAYSQKELLHQQERERLREMKSRLNFD